MPIDYTTIKQQAETLFNAKMFRENTIGLRNLVFDVEIEQEPYILKVSEKNDRNITHVDFELNWMSYLALKTDRVVKPIKSMNGRLYEVIEADNKIYILRIFKKARGKIVDCKNPIEFNDKLFNDIGILMGYMHKLAIEYNNDFINPEFEWYNNLYYLPEYNKLLDNEVRIFEERYINELHTLPKSRDCYGIIHGDIHIRNFFLYNGNISLFDFDVCCFGWYAFDIAKTLLLMTRHGVGFDDERTRTEFAENYLTSFLKGYLQENKIKDYWIYKLDIFMKHIITCGYRYVQNTRINKNIRLSDWDSEWHKHRIINNLPYVEIDYKKVVKSFPSIRTV